MTSKQVKILIVEDKEETLQSCRDSIRTFNRDSEFEIILSEASTVEEAFVKIDRDLDGAIIDLRLDKNPSEGNSVWEKINQLHLRIPVVVLTATPAEADTKLPHVGVFKKGEDNASYASLLAHLIGIHKTGITRIVGGRGIIEESLKKIYENNLLKQTETWVQHAKDDPQGTERALLRYTLSHLLQLLDADSEQYYTDEFYIHPPLFKTPKTGSIIQNENRTYIVLNPACDLVVREGSGINTSHILICNIVPKKPIVDHHLQNCGPKKKKKQECVKKLFSNNSNKYLHYLPQTRYFEGGFIDFRSLQSIPVDEFEKAYSQPNTQVSPLFIPEVISRFSMYYGRQGQPDMKLNDRIEAYMLPASPSATP